MSPRVLFVGGGKGSWQIRGIQIARALGARATVQPTEHDWIWAQIVVLVKRAMFVWGPEAAKRGVPVVWDVLDYWDQPNENALPIATHVDRIQQSAQACGVRTLIGATRAMAEAIGGVYIPHHARPGLQPLPVRETVQTVAYEGTGKYLGSWKRVLEEACAARGWRFVVNPPSLAQADIVVALRGGKWDGDVCREWKSGVKLVNAMAAGRPVITQDSAACREILPCGTVIEEPSQLAAVLDAWEPAKHRREAAPQLAYRLCFMADRYRALFQSVCQEAA